MLRCTLSSLIPLINSEKYHSFGLNLYKKYETSFHHILSSESYYILREIPQIILEEFFIDSIPSLLSKQNRSGMWKKRESERITFDILSALAKCNSKFRIENDLKYNPYSYVENKTDIYSVLIKKKFFNEKVPNINIELNKKIKDILLKQNKDGSWYSTVIGTAVVLDTLLLLGVDRSINEIKVGIEYLLSNLNEKQEGDHVGKPYGFVANYMFSTQNRNREYEVASLLKPEWIPRNVCYRHLGVIQNSICLNLLIKLGFEKQTEISLALDNLKEIEERWNGFCDSDIKKVYLQKQKEVDK